ncbi:hypothetical protein FCV25MIE_16265 [Fagus crenata]
MAGVYCSSIRAFPLPIHLSRRRLHRPRCSSTTPDNKTKTPQILKLTVTGVTELLRLFSSNQTRLERESDKEREEIAVSGIDDVVMILKSDYENAYFVTGKELYSRNLKLLVPFFDNPSIGLQKIKKERVDPILESSPTVNESEVQAADSDSCSSDDEIQADDTDPPRETPEMAIVCMAPSSPSSVWVDLALMESDGPMEFVSRAS